MCTHAVYSSKTQALAQQGVQLAASASCPEFLQEFINTSFLTFLVCASSRPRLQAILYTTKKKKDAKIWGSKPTGC